MAGTLKVLGSSHTATECSAVQRDIQGLDSTADVPGRLEHSELECSECSMRIRTFIKQTRASILKIDSDLISS